VIADYMDTPDKIKKSRQWMCNAQSEKIIRDKNSYWNRIKKQRCLIPVTGIFEHREINGWKNKVPYLIKIKNRELFCLPGLYSYAPVPDLETGEVKGTFTVVTRPANEVMRKIHNGGPNAHRMPLFLTKDLELEWLKPELHDKEIDEILNYELASEELDYWPVFSIRTLKDRPDNKTKIDPYAWPNLPVLGIEDGAAPIQSSLFG
jgi:putative SOS response-associated peptidase YedK